MRTPDTDSKAEAVRQFLVGKNVVIAEHHYRGVEDASGGRSGAAQSSQREWYYRYLIQDKAGVAEIRVTLDAMRDGGVDELGRSVVDGRRRKAMGEAGIVWVEMVAGRPVVTLEP